MTKHSKISNFTISTMRSFACALALTAFIVTPLFAQPDLEWEYRFDDFNGSFFDLFPTDDGVTGFGYAIDGNGERVLLCAELNSDGELLRLGSPPIGNAPSQEIVQTRESDYVLKSGFALYGISEDFEREWRRTYNDTEYDVFYDIVPWEDGAIAVGRKVIESVAVGWFLKVDGDGEILEERLYPDNMEEDDNYNRLELNSVALHPEGGLIVGYQDFYHGEVVTRYDQYLIHIDENGDSLDVIADFDIQWEGYSELIATRREMILRIGEGIRIVNYDGEIMHEERFLIRPGDAHSSQAFTLSRGGGGAIVGYTVEWRGDEDIHKNVFLTRFNENLEPLWWHYNRIMNDVEFGGAFAVCQGSDASYYIGGVKPGDGHNPPGYPILQKTSPDPSNISYCDDAVAPRAILVNPAYPNPFNECSYFEVQTSNSWGININMYDLSGRVILNETVSVRPGKSIYTINARDLAAGLYVVDFNGRNSRVQHSITIVK